MRNVPEGLGVENAEIGTSEVIAVLPIGTICGLLGKRIHDLCEEGNHLIVLDNANTPITPHFNLIIML